MRPWTSAGRPWPNIWLKELDVLLSWSLFFFVTSIVMAVLGFSGLGGTSGGIFRCIYFVCLVAFIVLLVSGLLFTKKRSSL